MKEKLGMCECENQACEDSDEHEAGSCSQEAVVRVRAYGILQNVCEDCHDRARLSLFAGGNEYVVVDDRRRK